MVFTAKYVQCFVKTGPAKTGPAGPFATALTIAIAPSDTCVGSEVLAQLGTECWKVLLYPLFY